MKKFVIIIFSALLFFTSVSASLADYGVQTKTSACAANQILPDSACTPGAILTTNTAVICKVGYTKTVRDVPLKERKQVFAEYGIPYSQHSKYEVDHLISLELGGSNDISNLWAEAGSIVSGSLTKDKFENYLHSQVCKGNITITEAQAEISGNWLQYYSAVPAAPKPKAKTPSTVVPKSPAPTSQPTSPTALCKDKSLSYSKTRSGTCSKHGGVAQWY